MSGKDFEIGQFLRIITGFGYVKSGTICKVIGSYDRFGSGLILASTLDRQFTGHIHFSRVTLLSPLEVLALHEEIDDEP